jgi:phage I-like protein
VKGRQSRVVRGGLAATLSYATTAFELGEAQAPPTEFRIFRAGVNPSDKGDFLFDDEAARMVMEAFAKKGTRLTMDYEHMALSDPPQIAPAACSSWVPEVRGGELWATQCNWTAKAADLIATRQYTRFSPAFMHEPKTMRVTRILNVALTNLEALDGVRPLVAASATAPGDPMRKMCCAKCSAALKTPTDDEDGDEAYCKTCSMGTAKMLTLVGLKATMAESEVAVELSSIASFNGEIMKLTGKTSRAEALGVIAGWKANSAEADALRKAAVDAEEKRLTAEFDGILERASVGAKLPPAERESVKALALVGSGGKVTADAIKALTAYFAARGTVVSTAETPARANAPVALTKEDIAVAKMLGNDLAEVEKFKVAQFTPVA